MNRLQQLSQRFFSHDKKFIILFGAPGVGKGTYSKMLAKDLRLNHISTGDQIRKIIKNPSSASYSASLIQNIKTIIKRGELIDDEIVIKIIEQKINQPESKHGIILDGFPRTLQQLKKYVSKFPLHGVLNLQLRKDVLIDKLLGRRVCKQCGTGFNVCNIQRGEYKMEAMLPKIQGICDNCGSQLVTRDDDRIDIIQSRMKQYRQKTAPLLQEFKKTGKLVTFECKRGIKDYSMLKQSIIKVINQ